MKTSLKKALALFTASVALATPLAEADERYIGEVFLVGFNFCPEGTLPAEGQELEIRTNTALFSLFGTTYGGDGRSTFALPDLRSTIAVGAGARPGLPEAEMGMRGGVGADIEGTGVGALVLRHCVVTEGVFPSRP